MFNVILSHRCRYKGYGFYLCSYVVCIYICSFVFKTNLIYTKFHKSKFQCQTLNLNSIVESQSNRIIKIQHFDAEINTEYWQISKKKMYVLKNKILCYNLSDFPWFKAASNSENCFVLILEQQMCWHNLNDYHYSNLNNTEHFFLL